VVLAEYEGGIWVGVSGRVHERGRDVEVGCLVVFIGSLWVIGGPLPWSEN